jgi:uncharacterized LabA/DUF88 family protein
MFSRQQEKIALFIDGANLYFTCLELKFQIDYVKLLQYFHSRNSYVAAARYYTAVDSNDQGYQNLRSLLTFLAHNGYSVIEKMAKAYQQPDGYRKIKGNMDVEFTLDVIEICKKVDRVVLFTGDGDFTALVRAVQEQACRVTVVSTVESGLIPVINSPYRAPMCSSDLKKAANDFIDLNKIRDKIQRT